MQLQRLRLLRRKLNESQSTIAENLNMTREAYSMYESGLRQPPFETLISLARYHGVSVDYLLGVTDIPNTLYDLHSRDQYIFNYLPFLDDNMKNFIISIIRYDPFVEKRRMEALSRHQRENGLRPSRGEGEEPASRS